MPSHHRYSQYFPILFLLADLVCLNIGIFLANEYRFGYLVPSKDYQLLQLILNAVWIGVFFSSNLQRINRNSRLLDHLNKVLTGLVINLSIVFALWFALQPVDYSRKYLFVTYLVFTILILGWRSVWHYLIRYYRIQGYNIRKVVIIGKGDLSDSLTQYFKETPELGYQLAGIVDDNDSADARLNEFEDFTINKEADIVFCCLPHLTDDQVKDVIDFAENNLIKVNLISQFSRLANYNLSIEQFGNIPIINVNTIPLDSMVNRFIKRSFDIVFSSIFILLIFSWLVPIIGILIKMESKGPVFFKQKRHGKDNQGFMCWKFRTMTYQKNAEFKQATKNDNRITKIGAILRKTSIDELPQFINVFLGDMSVVGPRPHPIKLNEEFQPKIDRFWQRHAVKPGITGLAQARGFRGETAELSDMSGRVKLDRFYVKNWSLILDLKIIILTAMSIIKGDQNAY
ncbi:undecaprenyl-phosphate galactose phosphotransferase/putative colanic acid biosysnthesis UDP-glucose lipid carrier transferase [Ekhidna lutea]|uniref:Undecaprenyl-phosphate galactose phosphotransferase/putative colanic acid biosysnthesis UDP-glucose lipid carrier transferase n=1 Tax=Ekhidna lutea TaxID=447679 RepID=A0A239FJX4_EKHLU|nr:undecaprenyl-phosphate glucose phosphotransferase [Ekhidna lutea]SNS56522.1 undecaprenyl-phosphate galactose phosphotransferase/putative colanic acid biosysnthesis UDP-glucose lipid carrier transferase [Ekhidna lutea]